MRQHETVQRPICVQTYRTTTSNTPRFDNVCLNMWTSESVCRFILRAKRRNLQELRLAIIRKAGQFVDINDNDNK